MPQPVAKLHQVFETAFLSREALENSRTEKAWTWLGLGRRGIGFLLAPEYRLLERGPAPPAAGGRLCRGSSARRPDGFVVAERHRRPRPMGRRLGQLHGRLQVAEPADRGLALG